MCLFRGVPSQNLTTQQLLAGSSRQLLWNSSAVLTVLACALCFWSLVAGDRATAEHQGMCVSHLSFRYCANDLAP